MAALRTFQTFAAAAPVTASANRSKNGCFWKGVSELVLGKLQEFLLLLMRLKGLFLSPLDLPVTGGPMSVLIAFQERFIALYRIEDHAQRDAS